MALKAPTGEKMLLWKSLSLVGEMLLAGNWLLFSVAFGKVNFKTALKKWKWVLPFTYLFPSVLVVSLFITHQAMTLGQPRLIMLGALARYFHISLLLLVITSLMNLENTFRSSAGLERWRIKYFLFGIGAILVFYVYTLCQRLLYYAIDMNTIYIMSPVLIAANILIIYSIIRTGVVDGDIYISRRVIYTSISLIAIGLYSIIIALLAKIVKLFHVSSYLKLDVLLIFFAILAMVITFYKESFRRKVKTTINRNFKKSKYVYRDELLVFSTELSKSVSCKELCESFLKTLSERIFVNTLSLWLVGKNQTNLHIISSHNLEMTNTQIKTGDRTIQYLYEQNKPSSKLDLMRNKKLLPISKEFSTVLDNTKAELLVPLKFGNRWIGLLTLGGIQTGEAYDVEEDYNLLQSVAAHAASAIHNARLFDEQMRTRELETFNRLSSFVMHDLKNATSMLSMVVQNAKKHLCDSEFQEDALQSISSAVAKMKNMINSLSAFPAELMLQEQDLDLNELINEGIENFASNNFSQVSIERRLGHIPLVNADAEEMHKVVHNLLLNANEALNGRGLITISTVANGDHVVFSVTDDGPGMSQEFVKNALFQPFRSTKKNGLGIGMYQCKTLVEAHNGRIEVDSKPGKGSTFSVCLPACNQ